MAGKMKDRKDGKCFVRRAPSGGTYLICHSKKELARQKKQKEDNLKKFKKQQKEREAKLKKIADAKKKKDAKKKADKKKGGKKKK